jgi:hypothetical protein
MIDAAIVQAPHTAYFRAGSLEKGIGDVLGTQHADGSFGGTWYLGGQKNFMVGILLNALVRYYEEVSPDPRIPVAVKRAVDYMWATQWVPRERGFKYVSVDSTKEGINQSKPEPSLNGLVIPGFSFVAAHTGDARYRMQVADILGGLYQNKINWPGWPTQFDQAYLRLFNHFARAKGVRVARLGTTARAARR